MLGYSFAAGSTDGPGNMTNIAIDTATVVGSTIILLIEAGTTDGHTNGQT